jgi:riboflavin kinase/FMN adenylyltransferase
VIVSRGPVANWKPRNRPTAITIGVLDGIHLGHQVLLERLSDSAEKTVLTFDPHPVEVLRPGTDPRLITTVEERAALLADRGVSSVYVLDLAEIKELEATEFVEEILVDRLCIGQLVVGVDFRFGKNRAGDVNLLRALGEEHGFDQVVVDLVDDGSGVVSSSRIRTLIGDGDVRGATSLLASTFKLSNVVVKGDKRGRELGFPTANLEPPLRKVVPGIGVYAGFARVGGDIHKAAINVGVRPTFGVGDLLIEVHLLDFDGDLYGREMTVEFIERMRPELRFDDVASLIAAMKNDVETTLRILSGVETNMS